SASPAASPSPTPAPRWNLTLQAPLGSGNLKSPVQVKVKVSGPFAGAEVELLVAGERVAVIPLRSATFSHELTLTAGAHELTMVLRTQGAVRKRLVVKLNVEETLAVPSWWKKVAETRRPRLPLPQGMTFGVKTGTYLSKADRSKMVYVPGGELLMGESGRSVQVESFFMGRYEVTREQFAKVTKSGRLPRGDKTWPQTNVSWTEADAYCRQAGRGLRLPTEAEWERAARGPKNWAWPWGNKAPDAGRINAGTGKLASVGKFKRGASFLGCLDMAGNASEWVADWLDKTKKKRVWKGGGYTIAPAGCRPTKRLGFPPGLKRKELGFRVARSAR
ncbi:MAG: SUMF1/EgtB/PvdO family nonheme iron enzyme, partial [Planctomycetes bacterium]|nr:SUMF1/EgtB/PvdO family nonheme iron enzyme [Planctomycetota bacterium]